MRITSLLLGCGLLIAAASGAADLTVQEAVPLADVRRDADGDLLPDRLGAVLTVAGIASCDMDTFHTKRLQVYIQDTTGGILLFSNHIGEPISEGDRIVARGILGHHRGQTELQVTGYRVVESGLSVPEPQHLSLAPEVLEKHEGTLARVRGRVVGQGRNQGGAFLLLEEDNETPGETSRIIVFIHNTRTTPIELDPYSVGDRLEVSGIVSQYDYGPPYADDHEILPRRAGDVEPIGLTGLFYRRALRFGGPILFLAVAWLVGLRLQVRVRTRQRAAAEQQLAHERRQHTITLQSIGEGVITADMNGHITLLNQRAEILTGWNDAEARGRPLAEVLRLRTQEPARNTDETARQILNTDHVLTLPPDTSLLTRDGTSRPVACTATPLSDAEGNRLGTVVAFENRARRARVELERQKAGRLEAIGLLAGGIAHDFNNLLTVIMGNLSLAQTATQNGQPCENELGSAAKAAEQAQSLTQQLLTFSRGGTPLKRPMRLHNLVSDAAQLAARGSNCRCETEIPKELYAVEADAGQLSQVIHNIVLNAQAAMPDGGRIRITASNLEMTPDAEAPSYPLPDGRYVRIDIQDHGTGIPEQHLQNIFDPYFTTKEKGTGLGLATSYSIVQNHGGHLCVESVVGKGSTFTLVLPATDRTVVETEPGRGAVAAGSGRVLVMDDEEAVRLVASRMLQRAGYDPDTVSDGERAISAYQRAREEGRPYAAVILDLTVPDGMGGEEAVKRIREIDPRARILASSGYATGPILADYKVYGFDGIVPKPYTISDLSRALADLPGQPASDEVHTLTERREPHGTAVR